MAVFKHLKYKEQQLAIYVIGGILAAGTLLVIILQISDAKRTGTEAIRNVNIVHGQLKAYNDVITTLSRQIELNRVEYPLLWNVEQYACKEKELLGNQWHDHTICHDFGKPTKNMVMYSFGVGVDCSFDLEMIAKYGLTVHAFDPSPASVRYIDRQSHAFPKQFHFHEWGLWNFDGIIEMQRKDEAQHSVVRLDGTAPYSSFQMYTLQTIMQKLGHTTIDILKIDIEGSEWVVFEKLLRAAYSYHDIDLFERMGIKQIITEFHHPNYDMKYGQGKSAPDVNIIIQKLNALGYYTFDIGELRENFQYREMSFIKIKDKTLVRVTSGKHVYDYI